MNFKNIWCVLLCASALTPGHSNAAANAAANFAKNISTLAKLAGISTAMAYVLYRRDKLENYINDVWKPIEKANKDRNYKIQYTKDEIKKKVTILENFEKQDSRINLGMDFGLTLSDFTV